MPVFSITRVLAIIRQELRVQLYNRQSRFMLIVPPLMQIIFFAWAATMEVRNVEIGILDHDSGRWSQAVAHNIRGSTTFKSLVFLPGEDAVKTALDRQDVLAVLVFDAEFSRKIESGQPAQIQVLLDGRRSNAAQILCYYLQTMVQDIAAATPLAHSYSAYSPGSVDIAPRYWFNPNLEFQWFFLPNLIGVLSFMLGLVLTGLSVAREREAGTFDQLLVSPATPLEIALGKLLPGSLIGLFHGTFFLLITHYGFGVPVEGSIPLLYVAMFIFSLAAGGIGLMVSSFSDTQQQAFLGSFTIGVPIILLAGTVSPVVNMPYVLQLTAEINPLYHFMNITQGLFLKDMSMETVTIILLKITLITICSVIISIWMFRHKA